MTFDQRVYKELLWIYSQIKDINVWEIAHITGGSIINHFLGIK